MFKTSFPIVCIGIILFCTYLMIMKSYRWFYYALRKKIFSRLFFQDFRQKMWITIGLGFTFFGLYFTFILLISKFMNPQFGQTLFLSIYQHPIDFIYLGLFIFALIALLIYFTRMIIKYFYLKNK
jgi:hypothetical protein